MNDETLEQKLRELPTPELPGKWRAEILAEARREARSQKREVGPTVLVYLRSLWVRNPVTVSAMAALWMLIFVFKANTPVDPEEKMLLAHYDPSRPVYLVSISDEIHLARLLRELDEPPQEPLEQRP